MERYLIIILFALLPSIGLKANEAKADSLVKNIVAFAPLYEGLVGEYHAEMYLKSEMYVRKSNRLMRFLPSSFRAKKGVREFIIETYSDIHYTAPDIYDQKVIAVSGTTDRFRRGDAHILEFFNINVYSSYLLRSKLISPLSASAPKYYSYHVDSVFNYKDHLAYRISFKPQFKNYQLVSGYMIISDQLWSVRELEFTGRSEYLHFHSHIKMGDIDSEKEFLPVSISLNSTFSLLGNKIDGVFISTIEYDSVTLKESMLDTKRNRSNKTNYDLTESFNLQCDTAAFTTDPAVFDSLRTIPLTQYEELIYQKYFKQNDSTVLNKEDDCEEQKPSRVFWGQLGDMFLDDYTINVADLGSIKASPLINPLLVSYSGNNGLSYKQEFKYNRVFKGDRLLRVVPNIGYNFTFREFYYSINADYYYWPRKRASLHLKAGNGNRIYSSDVLDDLKQIPDSVFDFDKIGLDYFRDLFFNVRHSYEITNGLILDIGVSMHRRTAINPTSYTEGLNSLQTIRDTYISFAPRVKLSWTPGQYYYMNGDRKINLHSRFPTFSLDWERGIPGVFDSTGKYERLEFDMQHKLSLGLMRNLYYRVGGGAFTDQSELYFVDFMNFSKNNLPMGWNDDIGGVFQALDRRWYNASHKYLRANVTYETPFLFLSRLKKNAHYILNERVYLGVLTTPRLNPYLELGYGIGTHVFDVGVFVSNTNGKFSRVGFKFTFELFNR